jgi:hypothetical protein
MSVESENFLSPGELIPDVHEQVNVVLGTCKIVVSLVKGVTLGSEAWVKV